MAGASSSQPTNIANLNSGLAPLSDPPLSAPSTTYLTIDMNIPFPTGTTDAVSWAHSKGPRTNDV